MARNRTPPSPTTTASVSVPAMSAASTTATTDYGYRWTTGLSDATAGEQFYQVLDELNNVYRLSIGQYNSGQSSTNNQTVVNAAGSGAVVLNGSTNSGTGGVIFGAGGP